MPRRSWEVGARSLRRRQGRVAPGAAGIGGGAATTDGLGIDQSTAITGAALVFDLRGISRPVAANIVVGAGDLIDMATSTDPDALLDADHASWQEVRAASGFSVIEMITAAGVAGVRIRRTSGSSSGSSVRVYAPLRGSTGYNPFYDVAIAGDSDWLRLLTQGTMGVTMANVGSPPSTVGSWISAQMALPAALTLSGTAGVETNGGQFTAEVASAEIYRTNILSDGQLRCRAAFALSQLVVAGHTQSTVAKDGKTWRTGLMERAFGNYKDILYWSVVHRNMGNFLNNLQNNARNGVPPNQNYARELLQLFSLGQEVLDDYGDPVIDPETVDPSIGFAGSPRRTYVQADIDSLSRLLCGWSFPGQNGVPAGDFPEDRQMNPAPLLAYNGAAREFLGFNETDYPCFGPDGTIGTPSVNGYTPTVDRIYERVDACLDVIMAQPTIAPFVCKRLITRMVTDNPSSQYVYRVVQAFKNNGFGVRGDLAAVFRAILIDPEARGNSKDAETFGRFREPTLMATQLFRYADHPTWNVWGAAGNGDQRRAWWVFSGDSPAVMRQMKNWDGNPESVFYDSPAEYEIEDGFLAPHASLRGTSGIAGHLGVLVANADKMALVNTTDNNTWGDWQCTSMIAFFNAAAGDAAGKNAALFDRVYADLHQGRAAPSDVRSEMLSYMAYMDGIGGATTRRKCVWLLAAISASNQFWVNV